MFYVLYGVLAVLCFGSGIVTGSLLEPDYPFVLRLVVGVCFLASIVVVGLVVGWGLHIITSLIWVVFIQKNRRR